MRIPACFTHAGLHEASADLPVAAGDLRADFSRRVLQAEGRFDIDEPGPKGGQTINDRRMTTSWRFVGLATQIDREVGMLLRHAAAE
ncbi:MAG: hypothetical protein MI806_01880 [Minwuiales bacterium]|nr:hypothetical protein [Minwuiales bacterium]